jgi:hypothetical protein
MGARQTVIRTVIEPSESLEQKQVRLSKDSRLPAHWQPSELELQWARGERPDLDLHKEADKFRDYWTAKSGKNAIKADWCAAWRNWIRNAYGHAPAGVAKPIRESLSERSARLNRDLDMAEEGKRHVALVP